MQPEHGMDGSEGLDGVLDAIEEEEGELKDGTANGMGRRRISFRDFGDGSLKETGD